MTKNLFPALLLGFYALACSVCLWAVAPAPVWAFLASVTLAGCCFFAYGVILRAVNL